jgi:diadenosine tetraphosphatase ApaH/serine/threonine PP2A family protein phosphatase
MDRLDLDAVLAHLEDGKHLDELSITLLLAKITEVLYEEPNVLPLSAPITVVGDLHGQLYDLFEILEIGGSPASTQYVFQGDYVDRGRFSMGTFIYLVVLKLKFPARVWLLRGNHESRQVSKLYGFYNEVLQTYGHAGLWNLCQDVFDLLPVAALINRRIFSVHGGLSPSVALVEKIDLLERQAELGTEGPLPDLAWSDPDNEVAGWRVSPRGAGWRFGTGPANEFCRNNKLDLVTRAHELVQTGFQYNCNDRILTVWSAPNYGYVNTNDAAILRLSETLERSLVLIAPRPSDKRKLPDDFVPHCFT